jgi:hypothetical protein
MKKPKVIVLSSLAQNTGCYLRALYLSEALKNAGVDVKYLKPFPKSLPLMFDLILSIPVNFFRILLEKSDFIIGIKPFPNLTLPMLAKKLTGSKIIIDIDDVDFGYRGGFLSMINSFVQKPFPKYFDIVTYHNSLLYDYIKKEFCVNEENNFLIFASIFFSQFLIFFLIIKNPQINSLL